jgi:hypothetical protein
VPLQDNRMSMITGQQTVECADWNTWGGRGFGKSFGVRLRIQVDGYVSSLLPLHSPGRAIIIETKLVAPTAVLRCSLFCCSRVSRSGDGLAGSFLLLVVLVMACTALVSSATQLAMQKFTAASAHWAAAFAGAYKYLEELWRKKQSDVLRFLLRVRVWEYR